MHSFALFARFVRELIPIFSRIEWRFFLVV